MSLFFPLFFSACLSPFLFLLLLCLIVLRSFSQSFTSLRVGQRMSCFVVLLALVSQPKQNYHPQTWRCKQNRRKGEKKKKSLSANPPHVNYLSAHATGVSATSQCPAPLFSDIIIPLHLSSLTPSISPQFRAHPHAQH